MAATLGCHSQSDLLQASFRLHAARTNRFGSDVESALEVQVRVDAARVRDPAGLPAGRRAVEVHVHLPVGVAGRIATQELRRPQ